MDALDLKILRTMGLRPFARWPRRPGGLKPSAVAAGLGVNVELVRDRVGRMESSGLIRGYRTMPNVRLFGLDLASHHFIADPEAKDGSLDRLADVDGVVGVYDYVGADMCVDLSYGDARERDRRLRLISELIGAQQGAYGFYEREFAHVTRTLSSLDWRIMRAIRGDARRPVSAIAKEVGVTAKTVRARLARMRTEGAIDEYVDVDLTQALGVVTFGLVFWFPKSEQERIVGDLLKLFDDYYLAAWTPPPGGLGTFDMDLFANSLAEMRELESQARAVAGIERVACLVPRGGYYNEDWFDERIRSQSEQAAQ